MTRAAARATDLFKAILLIKFHGVVHSVKGFQVTVCVPKCLRSIQAFR